MKKQKIVFMGTPDFAAYILEQLCQSALYEIVAVVTQPDKPVGRKRLLTPPAVKVVAQKYELVVLQPHKVGECYDALASLEPDVIVTAAYGQLVPDEILTLPRLRAINVHGSLLPLYRGGAPIQRAIVDGRTQTGISIMYMVKRLDAGAVLAQRVIDILPQDTYGSLYGRLKEVGSELLLEMLPAFFAQKLVATEQDEEAVSYAPNITRAEERIDWYQSTDAVYNHIRGFSPSPGTYTSIGTVQMKVFFGEPIYQETGEAPGTIVAVNRKQCLVATSDGMISLMDVQISGKSRQSIQEALNGVGQKLLIVGAKFE